MPAPTEVALEHAAERRRTVLTVATEAKAAWRAVDPARIAESWTAQLDRLLVLLTGAQRVVAGKADKYLDDVLDAQNLNPAADARTVPAALAGIASDGRHLDTLLYQPAITALTGIQRGMGVDRALASGHAALDMIVRTQVADAGRVADQVATAARPQATGYVRMLVGKSCSRCAILAGRWYRYNAGFSRHPRCDCIGVPGRQNTVGDIATDPKAFFRSLSTGEQDRVFTKAGAQAIREGADIAKVVNARRGLYTADGRLFTREAAARRPRLMPEQIFRDAKDRDDALRLLKLHGYITTSAAGTSRTIVARVASTRTPVRIAEVAAPAPLTFDQRLTVAATKDEALAAAQFGLGRRPRPDEFTSDMSRAVNTYTGAEYDAVNRHLRGQRLPYGYDTADVTPVIANIDQALALSRLDREVVVYRGVRDASTMLGERLAGNLTGVQWREDAYLSTTASQRKAGGFASSTGNAPMVMRVLVPAGTPAIEASGMQLEAELLIARGARLRVVADRGVSPTGVRHVDVEVIA